MMRQKASSAGSSSGVQPLRSFLRSRRGGGMLIGCAFALSFLASIGALMSNYAWREAQWEEIRAALRAAVSAAGPLLFGSQGRLEGAAEERIGEFLSGTLPRLDLEGVEVDYDIETKVTTVSISGNYDFHDIWASDSGDPDQIEESLGAKLDADRYEVAVALDVSGSMLGEIRSGADGNLIVKLDSLKAAMTNVTNVMREASATTPGSLMLAIVPFASAVNVADTATDGPVSDAKRTAAKERYVRMLAGAPDKGESVSATLKAARDAVEAGNGQWVDTFHHYGVGRDLGLLRMQGLPSGVLDNTDWSLRREDVILDVGAQVPNLNRDSEGNGGRWQVDDEDFWNGCVMARWGAYWAEDARPVGWIADQASNWPAVKRVAGWSEAAEDLSASTPLHLSDAPPDADDPHTLFTAYSWPDARIGAQDDHRLQTIMAQLLDQSGSNEGLELITLRGNRLGGREHLTGYVTQAYNDWSADGSVGGSTLCPESPVIPLTEDLQTLGNAINNLATVPVLYPGTDSGGTYVHLGVVWGLRSLSPLWQQVWQVEDLLDNSRPGVPCEPGVTASDCTTRLNKSILIVSDGISFPGTLLRSRTSDPTDTGNPMWRDSSICSVFNSRRFTAYHDAAGVDEQSDFDPFFEDYLEAGRFGGSGMDQVLDAFRLLDNRLGFETPARRNLRSAVLANLTPWQLFRGLDANTIDALVDESNEFGFAARPIQIGHFCQPSSIFGPYGMIGDHVYVGDTTTVPATPIPPVEDMAPFDLSGLTEAVAGNGRPGSGDFSNALYRHFRGVLENWLVEACRLAGSRRVRINAIYIGNANRGQDDILALERCIDQAGGIEGEQDVFVTPDSEAIQNAFQELFAVRRNLRFLN